MATKVTSTRLICKECIDALGLGMPTRYELAEQNILILLKNGTVVIHKPPPVRNIPANDFCDKCAKVLKHYGINNIQHGDVETDRFHF